MANIERRETFPCLYQETMVVIFPPGLRPCSAWVAPDKLELNNWTKFVTSDREFM